MITLTNDRRHGVHIYDNGSLRVIVYKVGTTWTCRAGTRLIGMTAPETEALVTFIRRKDAEIYALGYLRD